MFVIGLKENAVQDRKMVELGLSKMCVSSSKSLSYGLCSHSISWLKLKEDNPRIPRQWHSPRRLVRRRGTQHWIFRPSYEPRSIAGG